MARVARVDNRSINGEPHAKPGHGSQASNDPMARLKIISDRFEAKKQRRETLRVELRDKYPEIAILVDEYRAAFGPQVKVTEFEERNSNG